mmetsp:Transcript_28990/g.46736  ORF Transcript_28990/g.46736 Transcript_28990/m.46736 type:complete len:231 (-) Transcript_28990:341-1033(-)
MLQGLPNRHAPPRIDHQQLQDEIHTQLRTTRRFLSEKGSELIVFKELPICILLCRTCTQEQRLRCEKIERAPAQAPCINLRAIIMLLLVNFWWPEGLTHEAMKLDRNFLATLVHLELDCLPRIDDFHLVFTVLFHMQEHVLQGHILHREMSIVKSCQTSGRLPNQKLGLLLLEAARLELQGFQEIATTSQFKHDVMTVLVLEVVLDLHYMFVSAHQLHVCDFAQRHLTKF